MTELFSTQLLSYSLLRLIERLANPGKEGVTSSVTLAVTTVEGEKNYACKALLSRIQEFITKSKSSMHPLGIKNLTLMVD